MSAINDGGPAFPVPNDANVNNQEGMSIRDYFAAAALAHIGNEYVATGDITRQAQDHAMQLAAHAYNIADAMLKAREA
mgnify:FL=1